MRFKPLRHRVDHRQDEIGELGAHTGCERRGDLGLAQFGATGGDERRA